MGRFSAWEIVVIVILVLLIFGGRRLPELGRALGKGIANFRGSVSGDKTASGEAGKDEAKKDGANGGGPDGGKSA